VALRNCRCLFIIDDLSARRMQKPPRFTSKQLLLGGISLHLARPANVYYSYICTLVWSTRPCM